MEEKKDSVKYAKDFKCSYVDEKGNPCSENAMAFYPVFDIDQDAIPLPYCQKHLDETKNEFLFAIFNPEEYEKSLRRKEKKKRRK